MKIQNLKVQGFRSLKDITWEPADLNVVIGPNGSGKSNLLRFLEMVAVSARGGLGKYVQRAGGLEAMVWDGSLDGLGFTLLTSSTESTADISPGSRSYELVLARLGLGSAYRIDHELLANYYCVERGELSHPQKLLERNNNSAIFFDEHEMPLSGHQLPKEDETLLSLATGSFSANIHLPIVRAQLSGWRIYHDMDVSRNAPVRQAVVTPL